MLAALALACALLVVPALGAPASSGASPTITTTGPGGGTWVGKASNGVESYRGIPFALPPLGALRFAPPVPATQNFGTYDATRFGYACPQTGILAGALPGVLDVLGANVISLVERVVPFLSDQLAGNFTEDCLTLNVQRPAGIDPSVKLPVMFWIYGGAFNMGGSSAFDADKLVARSVARGQPVIFVSANHRVNIFGFPPGRQAQADPTVSVNAGLLDQRLVMHWIQSHIAEFGGDPTKVTLFGESSGAISIGFHMLVNGGDTEGLYRGAILESGAPVPVEGPSRGQASFDIVSAAVGCSPASDAIACLRAVPYPKLLAAVQTIGNILSARSVSLAWIPRTDGVFLTEEAPKLIAAGKYAKIPMIAGNQCDEGTLLTLGTLNLTTTKDVADWLAGTWFPNATAADITQMLVEYPQDPTQGSPFDSGYLNILTPQNKRISALIGDAVFQAPRRAFMSVTQGTQPVWGYLSRALQGVPILGTFHTSDVYALDGILPINPSVEMQSRWIAFANTLDPNIPDGIAWPQYGSDASRPMLQFSIGRSSIISDSYRRGPISYLISLFDKLAF